MKIAFVSNNPEKLKKHVHTIQAYLKYVHEQPDVVVAIGGDGTFLAAEQKFPGVPKLIIREQSICKTCDWEDLGEGLRRIVAKKFHIEKHPKLAVTVGKNVLEGVNDVVIRNVEPTHAIRFKVWVDKDLLGEFIGDGIVVATVFGSSAYFRSITGRHFESGIGIAFNNVTEKMVPTFVQERKRIAVEITRGYGHVAVDNNPDILYVKKGDIISIKHSGNYAEVVTF